MMYWMTIVAAVTAAVIHHHLLLRTKNNNSHHYNQETKDSVQTRMTEPTPSSNNNSKDWKTGLPTTLLRKVTLIPESKDHLPVHTLTFQIPYINDDDLTAYKASNNRYRSHSELQLDMGDIVKMVIPGYKPKSYSVSDLRITDNEFDITFKVYPNGRASGHLNRLQVGDVTYSFGMSSTRIRQPGKYVGIIAYGVGMTEAFPVTRAELEKDDAQKVILLWASRTKDDTFWNDELDKLQTKYPTKFQLQMILSRQPEVEQGDEEEEETHFIKGRITSQVLSDVFNCEKVGISSTEARFLSVGTKEMMKLTDDMFNEIGFPQPQYSLIPKVK